LKVQPSADASLPLGWIWRLSIVKESEFLRTDPDPDPFVRISPVFRLIGLCISLACRSSFGFSPPPQDSPLAGATVIVIRHAEKQPDGDGLTPAGIARAGAYPTFFKSLKVGGVPFRITHIVATHDSKHSARERLTVEPLAKGLHIEIDSRFKNGAFQELTSDLETHEYGKGIVICWHHGKIPALLSSLGAPPNLVPGGTWPTNTYDWMVELRFDAQGKLIPRDAKIVHEHLMPGDAR
jgi:hypothetical protein